MAKLGVKTIYLQASQDDTRSEGTIVDRRLVGDILRRAAPARRAGRRLVPPALRRRRPGPAPHRGDARLPLRRSALRRHRAGRRVDERRQGPGQAQPGVGRHWPSGRTGPSRDVPLGAIVLEPVLLEDINLAYWPNFPWKKLGSLFDVWLPMAYWTNRTDASGWNNGFRYTSENIRRVRANLGDRNARRPCHRRDRGPDQGGGHGGLRAGGEGAPGDRLVGLRLRHHVEQRLAQPPRLTTPVLGTLRAFWTPRTCREGRWWGQSNLTAE